MGGERGRTWKGGGGRGLGGSGPPPRPHSLFCPQCELSAMEGMKACMTYFPRACGSLKVSERADPSLCADPRRGVRAAVRPARPPASAAATSRLQARKRVLVAPSRVRAWSNWPEVGRDPTPCLRPEPGLLTLPALLSGPLDSPALFPAVRPHFVPSSRKPSRLLTSPYQLCLSSPPLPPSPRPS